jgi:tRNA-dihydrouridine synthase 3
MSGSPSPFAGKLWLAPLTRGGHLAFRRLCVSFGAEVTVSEMVVARNLLRGRKAEFALLKSHPEEPLFGVQLADRRPESLAEAGRIAEGRGARFLDLNCGCPIDAITRRGLGASLLRKPARLARLIEALRRAVRVPVTVKLRTGWAAGRENLEQLARACEEAGAQAIVVHGRTREQRYGHAADWDRIGRVAAERRIPVVGNGDILTHYEAHERWSRTGVASIMLARGALIKPWLFREIHERRAWEPGAEERLGIYWRFVELLRDHFGAEARGRRRILGFLPWHLGFFCRYRPLPAADYLAASRRHPLLQTRLPRDAPASSLEALLRDPRPETHERLAEALLDARSPEEAEERARVLARDASFPGEDALGQDAPAEVAG